MSQTLYVLDAHSMIFQVYHAIPEMTGPAGQPTNAVFGFTRDILNLLRDRKPDYLICAFDLPGPTVRHELYPEYKAQRAEMPDDLRPQIEMIREVLDAFGIPVLEMEGYEADDVIATVATAAVDEGLEVSIVSGDKDVRQLLGPHVRIFNVRKGEVFDAATLEKDWGVSPEQVVDLLALTGDSVDNVPGVPGVGVKTAAKLLQEFDTLEGVLDNVDRISGPKRRDQVRASAEQVMRSRELVRLETHLPLEIDWDACRTDGADRARLLELFVRLGFHRFAHEIEGPEQEQAGWEGTYEIVATAEALEQLAAALGRQPRFALELVSTDARPMECEVVGIAIVAQPGKAWYVPVGGEASPSPPKPRSRPGELPLWAAPKRLAAETVWQALGPVLENPDVEKVGRDLKSVALLARRAGFDLEGYGLDTLVCSYLLNAGERVHDLDQLSLTYLHRRLPLLPQVLEPSGAASVLEADPETLAAFSSQRVDSIWHIATLLEPKLREQQLWELYSDLERPLIPVLAEMEFHGIRVDVELLARLSRQFQERLAAIEREVFELAGRQFNLGSPVQLRKVLFEDLRLQPAKRTGAGALSTDQEVLEQLATEHPLPGLLLEHRKLAKLKGTYLDALPALVNPRTGRVHASFNQAVAATGRLSSSDPNLQNVPVRTEEGRQIRQAFVPVEGWLLLTADYSQIELRVLAALSGDQALRSAFEQGEDIHTFVASQIYGVGHEEVTSEMRRTAKTVNFGIIYGLSPFGLANRLGITQQEASGYIDAYFARYPGVEEFSRKTLELARKNGYVKTVLGRRRAISGIRPVFGRQRNLPERTAINTVIQGSAADLIKRAMIGIHRRLHEDGLHGRVLLQIHDELVFEAPPEELDELATLVTEEMTLALPLGVPITVDLASGSNWLDVQGMESRM